VDRTAAAERTGEGSDGGGATRADAHAEAKVAAEGEGADAEGWIGASGRARQGDRIREQYGGQPPSGASTEPLGTQE
jgi:hypothetical protein